MGFVDLIVGYVPAAYAASSGDDVAGMGKIDQVWEGACGASLSGQMREATDAVQAQLVDQGLLLFGSMMTSAAILAVYIAVPLIVWHRAKQADGCSWSSAAHKGAFAGLVAAFVINIVAAIALLAVTATGIDDGYGQMSGVEVATVVIQMAAIAVCAYVVRISDARGQCVGLPIALVTLVLGNLVAGILLIIAWRRDCKAVAEPVEPAMPEDGGDGETR